jgi:hypothetical protein
VKHADQKNVTTLSIDVRNNLRRKYFFSIAIFSIVLFTILLAFIEGQGQLLPASILAYSSCFVLTVYFLRNRMRSTFEALLTSAATTFSGVWLYELFYHYAWGTSIGGIYYDFSHFSIVLYPGWAFPIWFTIAIILFPLLKREYVTLNMPLLVVATASIGFFAIWIDLGFPQFFYPQYYFGSLLSSALVREIGYTMNSISKLLAIVPAFLFCDRGQISFRSNSKRRSLENLKLVFLLLLAGGVMSSLPVVESAGFVLLFIGLLILVLSLTSLGRSDLKQSELYRFLGRPFVQLFLAGSVILVVGVILITAQLGSFAYSMLYAQSNVSIINRIFTEIPNFRNIYYEIFLLITAVYATWTLAWAHVCNLIRSLAEEISQSKLRRTAQLFSYYSIIGLASLVGLFTYVLLGGSGIFFGTSSTAIHLYDIMFYGAFYGVITKGGWTIFTALFFAQSVMVAIGSYIGFMSVRNALANTGPALEAEIFVG